MNLDGLIDFAGITDVGQVRSHNEDAINYHSGMGIAVLADGMGGHNAGEVASAIAITTIMEEIEKQIDKFEPGQVDEKSGYTYETLLARNAVRKANHAIYTAAREKPQYNGMGTTLVMAIFYDNRMTIANVGDSRLYRFREDNLEQVTIDHTLLQELVDRGFYTMEEAQKTVNRNVVTRALGIEADVEVDVHEEVVAPGDIYLLCSDGLNDMAESEEIRSILLESEEELEDKAKQLIKLANDKGGRDNVSVVLCRALKPFPVSRGIFKKLINWFS